MRLILLGMILWQLIIFAVYLLTLQDGDKTAIVGTGIFGLVVLLTYKIIQKALLLNSRRYNCYKVYTKPNEEPLHCYYMTEKTAKKFRQIDEREKPKPFCICFVYSGKDLKTAPLRKYIITNRRIREHTIFGLNEESLQKLLIKEENLGN